MASNRSIDQVFRELDGLDKKLRNKIIRQAQRAGAKILANEVQSRAPVASGRTKKSVKVRTGGRKKNKIITNVEISGSPDEGYIGFVEFGNVHQAPNPFIRGSVETKKTDVVDTIADEIDVGIRKGL